jgi:hypothetical protein
MRVLEARNRCSLFEEGYHGFKLAQGDGVLTSQLETTFPFELVDHLVGAGDQDDEPVRIPCSLGSPGLKGFVAPVEQRLGARDETTEVPWSICMPRRS